MIDEPEKMDSHARAGCFGDVIKAMDKIASKTFTDQYLRDFPVDLSRCDFALLMNYENLMDEIALDRGSKYVVPDPTLDAKIHVAQKFTLPEILDDIQWARNKFKITRSATKHLIEKIPYEAGHREMGRQLENIVLSVITENRFYPGTYTYPLTITKELIDKYVH